MAPRRATSCRRSASAAGWAAGPPPTRRPAPQRLHSPPRCASPRADGASCAPGPVIGGLPAGELDGFADGPLLEHVGAERMVGVLLVRLGAHAAGVFEGERLRRRRRSTAASCTAATAPAGRASAASSAAAPGQARGVAAGGDRGRRAGPAPARGGAWTPSWAAATAAPWPRSWPTAGWRRSPSLRGRARPSTCPSRGSRSCEAMPARFRSTLLIARAGRIELAARTTTVREGDSVAQHDAGRPAVDLAAARPRHDRCTARSTVRTWTGDGVAPGTYAEVGARAARLANALRGLGVDRRRAGRHVHVEQPGAPRGLPGRADAWARCCTRSTSACSPSSSPTSPTTPRTRSSSVDGSLVPLLAPVLRELRRPSST